MMIKRNKIKNAINPTFSVFIVSLILVCEIVGQQGRPVPSPPEWILENNRKRQEFNKLSGLDAGGNIRGTRKSEIILSESKIKLLKKDREKFAPLAEDVVTNAEFLAQQKTGIVRILDSVKCYDTNKVVTLDILRKCATNITFLFGSHFSFRASDHTLAGNSDLSIKNGTFVSYGKLVQTLIYNMGNYPLEKVTPESKSFIALNEFVNAETFEQVSEQFRNLEKGLKIQNFYFKNSLPIVLNSTYILRSIAFKSPPIAGKTKSSPKSSADDREDIILTFRVIRKDSDGSVTLLWKELSRKTAPEIVFTESN